eukprot:4200424-Amphidinium_carterae.1
MARHPCQNTDVYLVDHTVDGDVIDTYGRHLTAGQIDMRFTYRYASEGREIGETDRGDMWFEVRRVRVNNNSQELIDKQVIVTSTTVRQRSDPFNGDADREDMHLDEPIFPEDSTARPTAT